MSLKPITVLRRARKLIESPDRWIKGAFKGKRKGVQCYCGLGAIAAAAGVKIESGKLLSQAKRLPEEYYAAHNLLTLAAGHIEFFPKFNDAPDTTHKMVLDTFDVAIELAKANANRVRK